MIVVDGGYTGQNYRDAAAEKNVELINTCLMGTPVPDIYADFDISEDGEQILHCPAGHEPFRCKYISTSKQVKTYPRNVYAHSEEECEALLKEVIREVNIELAEARKQEKVS